MCKIYKCHLETKDEQTIKIPILTNGYNILDFKEQFLKIDVQHGDLCLWYMLDVNAEGLETPTIKLDRKFFIVGTGHEVPEELSKENYLGTYQLNGGDFIGHLFYK